MFQLSLCRGDDRGQGQLGEILAVTQKQRNGRLNREIRRRTRVVGAFPDGNSALMLVCARLRHVAGTQWGSKKYMNMKHLDALEDELQAG